MSTYDDAWGTWAEHVQESVREASKTFKLRLFGNTLFMAPVTGAHSDTDDSLRNQLARQLKNGSLKVLRDKGLLPKIDGYSPEPDVLVIDADAYDPMTAFYQHTVVRFVAESVSPSTGVQDYGRKRSQYALRAIPVYLIADVLTRECVLLRRPVGAEYQDQRTYPFGELISFEIAGVPVTIDTSFEI